MQMAHIYMRNDFTFFYFVNYLIAIPVSLWWLKQRFVQYCVDVDSVFMHSTEMSVIGYSAHCFKNTSLSCLSVGTKLMSDIMWGKFSRLSVYDPKWFKRTVLVSPSSCIWWFTVEENNIEQWKPGTL